MRNLFASLLSAAVVLSLSSCSSPQPSTSEASNELYTNSTVNLDGHLASIRHGERISDFLLSLEAEGIKTESDLNLREIIYTGPAMNKVSALDLIETVLGKSGLDFTFIHSGIKVVKAEYIRSSRIPRRLKTGFDNGTLTKQLQDEFLVRVFEKESIEIGTMHLSRDSNFLMIKAPLSVRQRVDLYIKGINNPSLSSTPLVVTQPSTEKVGEQPAEVTVSRPAPGQVIVVPDEDSLLQNQPMAIANTIGTDTTFTNLPTVQPTSAAHFVLKGTFHENVQRLAANYGFNPVIWDERIGQCAWEQVTEYELPKGDSRAAFAYYVSTLDFKPVFSEVDNHVQLIYVGPISRIQECVYEE